jgi:peroxiredoxin/DNA-binding transcriptional MerR regulator
MLIGELAARARVSAKAVRYYERLGLVSSARRPNGYREYDDAALRVVSEIRELSESGIAPSHAAAFVECLERGHEQSDDCVSTLVVYRDRIADLDSMITSLTERRQNLARRLEASATRTSIQGNTGTDYRRLPDNLPVPHDDGAAENLPGMRMPPIALTASDGAEIQFAEFGSGRTVIYLYPLTGRPDVDLPDGWDSIPGARGCSPEACDFRDHFAELTRAGARRVYGMSSQTTDYQAEVVDRLRLPFTMISDPSFSLADSLGLPTFSAPGHIRLYTRLTLVIQSGHIEHAFYPIFPPNTHAQEVLQWLEEHP